ncbi:MAG: hypothetical protein WBB28_29045 [Crinalium sp.]
MISYRIVVSGALVASSEHLLPGGDGVLWGDRAINSVKHSCIVLFQQALNN